MRDFGMSYGSNGSKPEAASDSLECAPDAGQVELSDLTG
jgi:hypothetical protein